MKIVLLSASLALVVSSCGIIDNLVEKESQEKSGDADALVLGDDNEKQGLFLSPLPYNEYGLTYARLRVFKGPVAIPDDSQECEMIAYPDPSYPEKPTKAPEVPDEKEAPMALTDAEEKAQEDIAEEPMPDPKDEASYGLMLEKILKPSNGEVKVKLPVGLYSVVIEAYGSDMKIKYRGISSMKIQSNSFSEVVVKLEKVKGSSCDGGAVIRYIFPDDGIDGDMVDVCKKIEYMPLPGQSLLSSLLGGSGNAYFPGERASCHMPPFNADGKVYEGVKGQATYSVAMAKYMLYKSICNSVGKVPVKQFESIMCESSVLPPQEPQPPLPQPPLPIADPPASDKP